MPSSASVANTNAPSSGLRSSAFSASLEARSRTLAGPGLGLPEGMTAEAGAVVADLTFLSVRTVGHVKSSAAHVGTI